MPSSRPFPHYSTGSSLRLPPEVNSCPLCQVCCNLSFPSLPRPMRGGGGGPEDAEVFLPRGDRDQPGGRTTGGGGRDDCDGRNDRAGMSGISDIVRYFQIYRIHRIYRIYRILSDIVRYCQISSDIDGYVGDGSL